MPKPTRDPPELAAARRRLLGGRSPTRLRPRTRHIAAVSAATNQQLPHEALVDQVPVSPAVSACPRVGAGRAAHEVC
jgi:hypothetical protein